MTPSRQRRLRRLSQRMLRAGWSTVPLCDESVERPNAMAMRHFPRTLAAVAAVGGFHARLWVLAPDKLPPRLVAGVSDGYWRVHAVIATDDDDDDEGDRDEAGVGAGKTGGDGHTAVSGSGGGGGGGFGGRDAVGIQVGDDRRGMMEKGAVRVVNDFHRRFFYNRNPEGGGCAVVLSFDVIRPEYASCRSSIIQHRSRVLQALGAGGGSGGGGEGGAWRHLWRSFSLSLLSNLS